MIINNRNASITITALICSALTVIYFTWSGLFSSMSSEMVVDDIVYHTEVYVTQSSEVEFVEITMPVISLEGTLLTGSKTASALIKVNNKPARWFYQGTDLLPGIEIIKIENDQILLKQNMAYYEIILNDNVDNQSR